jgi:hypothetical protein
MVNITVVTESIGGAVLGKLKMHEGPIHLVVIDYMDRISQWWQCLL